MLLMRKLSTVLKPLVNVSPLNVRQYFAATKSPVKMSTQNFDHFFVLDFEATCLRDQQIDPQEIIEFPCVKVDAKNFSVESSFHRYVRPVHLPNLSHFCTELVTIFVFVVIKSKFDNYLRLLSLKHYSDLLLIKAVQCTMYYIFQVIVELQAMKILNYLREL